MYFKDIIGNQVVKENLISSIKNNNILHAYMFIGKEGIGKKIIAKEFARLIMCEDKLHDIENMKCKSCTMFKADNHPDFFLIEPDGNSIKIEQIRKMISKIYEKPIASNKKVYIINNAERMTLESSNCLLKILEEPPEYVVIILIVSDESYMLDTIKSRCNKIIFDKISKDILNNYLIKQYNYPKINKRIENMIDGSISKALEIKDNLEVYSTADSIIELIEKKDILEVFKKIDIIKQNPNEILEYFILYFMERLRENTTSIEYIDAINIIEETKKNLMSNGNLDMVLDNMIIKLTK